MPRRKRHRRNRHKVQKQQQPITKNVQPEITDTIHLQETPKKSASDSFVSLSGTCPLLMPSTPPQKIAIYNASKSRSRSLVNATPMNTETIHIQETRKESACDSFVTLPSTCPSLTPSTPSPQKIAVYNVSKSRSRSLVNTTPMNTNKRNNNKINGTNLSKFFSVEDEQEKRNTCLNNVTPKRSSNIRNRSPLAKSYINNLSGSVSAANCFEHRLLKSRKIRTNSSISKLHSPGLDKIPIMVDIATQTVYFDNEIEKRKSFKNERSDICLQSCINIFETPKISQMEKLERAFDLNSPISCDLNALHKSNRKDLNMSNNNLQDLKYFQNLNDVILPNRYISPRVIQREYKQSDSDVELSIFSPHIKTSSTPKEALHKTDKIIENLAKNILNAQLIRGNEKFGSYFCNSSTPKTPNDKNINSKVEDKVRTQKINKLNSCVSKRRIYNSVSPKNLKDMSGKVYNHNRRYSSTITRVQSTRSNSNTVPKSFSPQKMSFSKSDNFLNLSNSNMYARFMTNIKKIHNRYSGKWFGRIMVICSSMGITIKKRLSSLCSVTSAGNQRTVVDLQEMTICDKICYNCKEYKEQIVTLAKKVGLLDRELHVDQEKIVNLNGEITHLNQEIGQIKGELTEFDVVKKKIQAMEEKLEKVGSQCPPAPSPLSLRTPPPPPPPIPPPPPPPFPTSTTSLPSNLRNFRSGSKKVDNKNCENSRPVISLDDILNVKLKKTSDKPAIARKSTQPFISVEMLNQIKLRPPTSRPETPSSKEASSPSSLLSSPATSLTRILSSVDPNVRRLKRLRRISGYSLDDSRKQFLKRERNGEDS